MSRSLLWIALAVALVAATVWYLSHRGPREAVFVIVVDTLRADRLSCYGYDGHATPGLDALAARGVQFDDAISVGGWTVPSMGGMMTSRYPTNLGLVEDFNDTRTFAVRERREQWEYSVAAGFTTLAEVMRDAGYYTAAFVNQPVLNNNPGWAQGFMEYTHPVGGDSLVLRENVMQTSDDIVWRDIYTADPLLVSRFVEWLPAVRAEKLFVWMHLITPHAPYEPPERFGVPANAHPSELYDAEVRFSDEMVTEVLAVIDDVVGADRTLVVFTSDHGEEFGEHGSHDHGHSLHRECVHVPLIFAGRGLPAGRRVSGTVRLIDVMPTVLALCDLAAAVPDGSEGIDLSPAIARGDADQPVFTEGMLYGSTERSWIDGGFRLMWDLQENSYRLFDVGSDPGETNNIAAQFPARTDSLRAAMTALHERLVAARAAFLQSEIIEDSLSSAKERRRALNAMRALGYVND